MRVRVRSGLAFGSLVLLTLVAAPAARATVIDTDVYNGHSYLLLDRSFWTDAEAEAVALGGHLVTIDDAVESSWVVNRFGVSTGVFAAREDLWLGLTDQAVEGTFVWTSGTPVGYTNWFPGEPNDCTLVAGICTSEDYVHIGWWSAPSYGWNDLPNDLETAHGVVELDHVVPEPSSLALLTLGLAGFSRRSRRPR